MSLENGYSQQLHLSQLGGFVGVLARALKLPAISKEEMSRALEQKVHGECMQCGIRLTGTELLALQGPAPADEGQKSPKVARLRQGYCGRNKCESYYYNFVFEETPGINWRQLLAQGETVAQENSSEEVAAEHAILATNRKRFFLRASLVTAAVAALLLARHLYRGGTIPFVREPEDFRVD